MTERINLLRHVGRARVAVRYRIDMAERKASDVFVECLEAEGVQYVFGIPGEETLDLASRWPTLRFSSLRSRHEQGGAYMADAYWPPDGSSRCLPGKPLARGDEPRHSRGRAFLDRAPLVALTGQSDLGAHAQESHQVHRSNRHHAPDR